MVVERAANALLPPHRLVGKVVEGFKRGSKELGWPTANLDPRAFETRLDAATEGVYVGWARISGQPAESAGVHKAVLSIGWNPHFDDLKERTVEAYLCHDFGGRDFYGSEMRLLVVSPDCTQSPASLAGCAVTSKRAADCDCSSLSRAYAVWLCAPASKI